MLVIWESHSREESLYFLLMPTIQYRHTIWLKQFQFWNIILILGLYIVVPKRLVKKLGSGICLSIRARGWPLIM